MKFYNHTKIDDKILEKVFYRAAKATGSVRTNKVIVKVNTSGKYISGVAFKTYGWLYKGWLEKNRKKDAYSLGWIGDAAEKIYTDGGYIVLRIPVWSDFYYDLLEFAEKIYKVAAHEWRHIRDYQKNAIFHSHKIRWKNRCQEKRAMFSEKKAMVIKDKRLDIQEDVINLGIQIEQLRMERK